jgi:hypothetical protein
LAGLLAIVASSAMAAQRAELAEALAAGFDSVEARRAHELLEGDHIGKIVLLPGG